MQLFLYNYVAIFFSLSVSTFRCWYTNAALSLENLHIIVLFTLENLQKMVLFSLENLQKLPNFAFEIILQ